MYGSDEIHGYPRCSTWLPKYSTNQIDPWRPHEGAKGLSFNVSIRKRFNFVILQRNQYPSDKISEIGLRNTWIFESIFITGMVFTSLYYFRNCTNKRKPWKLIGSAEELLENIKRNKDGHTLIRTFSQESISSATMRKKNTLTETFKNIRRKLVGKVSKKEKSSLRKVFKMTVARQKIFRSDKFENNFETYCI